jgi:hypothetical protein
MRRLPMPVPELPHVADRRNLRLAPGFWNRLFKWVLSDLRHGTSHSATQMPNVRIGDESFAGSWRPQPAGIQVREM